METIAADLILFIQFIRQRIHVSVTGHAGMECGVKNSDLRDMGVRFLDKFNTGQIRRVV